MKICIIGTGYVGLVTGACFAEAGNAVYCVDVNQGKINNLKKGILPIYEPGLENFVEHNIKKNRLFFTTDLSEGINNSDISFIAVGTPMDEDGSADLKAVFQVCEEICKIAKKEVILATKSTVPVGTGDKIEKLFQEKLKYPFIVFSNPEFLKEGDAVNDFMKPDRVIVGMNDQRMLPEIRELYSPFMHQQNRLFVMDRRSAEITKYAANAMLALRISFMNELANFCDKVGGDINAVRSGIGSDPRIGQKFLYPGLGFGGSCFPKDVKALLRMALDQEMMLETITASHSINEKQPQIFFNKIVKHFGNKENLKRKKIAIWGLAFKANTDDIRYSPALKLIECLLEVGADLHVYDPAASENTKKKYENRLTYYAEKMTCLKQADALVVATDWNEFKSPDFITIRSLLKSPVIFDGRNLYNSAHVKELGFQYTGVGVL